MEQELAAASSEVFALTDEQIVGLGAEEAAGDQGRVTNQKEECNSSGAKAQEAGGVHVAAEAATHKPEEGAQPLRDSGQADGGPYKGKDADSRSKDRPLHEEQGVERAASEGGRNKGTESQPGMAVPREVPQWLAERMKDPWHGDEAKEFWDGKQSAEKEAAAYREVFGTVEDAQALREIYPGGVNEAKAAAERARELEAIDAAFYRGDAAARMALAKRMMREDPGAFREMVEAGVRLLGAAGNTGREGESSKLKVEEEKQLTAETRRAAEIRREEGDQRAASGDQPDAQPRMAVPQEVVRAYREFEKTANAELEKRVGGTIARMMERALPNLRQVHPFEQAGAQHAAPLRERLAGAVREEVETALKSDRELGEQVTKILAGRRFDGTAQAQVVRLIDARAQQLVPGAVRRVVGSWTQATLGARGKTGSAASQAEAVESGPRVTPQTERTRHERVRELGELPVRRGPRVDYGRLSDEEILGM